jgi:hypothetical protein
MLLRYLLRRERRTGMLDLALSDRDDSAAAVHAVGRDKLSMPEGTGILPINFSHMETHQ